jgi:hypothetical protein
VVRGLSDGTVREALQQQDADERHATEHQEEPMAAGIPPPGPPIAHGDDDFFLLKPGGSACDLPWLVVGTTAGLVADVVLAGPREAGF